MALAVSSLLVGVADTTRGLIVQTAWGPLASTCRNLCLSLLQRIQKGQLVIIEEDGVVTVCGRKPAKTSAQYLSTKLLVRRDAFWVRLAFFADMVRSLCRMLIEEQVTDTIAGIRRELYARRD